MIILLFQLASASTSWPGSSDYTEIGSGLPASFEVSALFYNPENNKVFTVSDSGIISYMNIDGSSVVNYYLSGDYEGVTFANLSSNYVYIGIENPDSIVEFDTSTGRLTGKSWSLTSWMASSSANLGLEGLTFVPNGYHYYSTGRSGGLFLAALQENGVIYVFNVDTSTSGSVSYVTSFTPVAGRTDISDLYFDRTTAILYVLYDSSNTLVEMKMNGTILNDYLIPGSDQEGISIITSCPETTATILIGQDYGNSILAYTDYPEICPEIDSDGDLLSDSVEVTYGTDPNDADSDNDLLNDWEEIFRYSTDPNDSDSDNGGRSDYREVTTDATNPNNASDDKVLSIRRIRSPFFRIS